MEETGRRILILGGAGYVGAVLVPKLLDQGHDVRVLDLFIYGEEPLAQCEANPKFSKVKGDIRDQDIVKQAMNDRDVVIHLACISNDPSYNLDPDLGKSINHDCLPMIINEAKSAGVDRFVFASSSSVYGYKEEPNVTEELSLEPLTDYSKYKALGEDISLAAREPGFNVLIVRPATVCGYSPRQRLDLVVNILTNHALVNKKILVFGGEQMRANLHIEDMTDFYVESFKWSNEQIDGKIYNVGCDNHTVRGIADIVKEELGSSIEIETVPTDDNRSYHISSEKIADELGFRPKHSLTDAVRDVVKAYNDGILPDSMTDSKYFNVKRMQEIKLS